VAKTVVLVPGLFGSSLRQKPETTGTSGVVWYDRQELLLNGPDPLQLDVDGESPGPLAEGYDLVPGSVMTAWQNYGNMVARLTADNWTVVEAPYDWRTSVQDGADKLLTKLYALPAEQTFSVLAYSMGGLVARLAYGQFRANAGPDRWRKTVYVGTPHDGSHAAAIGLANPLVPEGITGFLFRTLPNWINRVTTLGFADDRDARSKRVAASWQSLYSLLPSITGVWAGVNPLDPVLRAAPNYVRENAFVDAGWFLLATQTRAALAETRTLPLPAEHCVVGTGVSTPYRLAQPFPARLGDPASYDVIHLGDGVVTVARGTLPNIPTLTIQGATHEQLFGHPQLLSRVSVLLADDVSASLMPPPILVPYKEIGNAAPTPVVPVVAFPDVQVRGDP
jgi:hypothetical protein